MTPAPVGLRCPDHAGARKLVKPPRVVRRAPMGATEALVTRTLIGINIAVYLVTVVQGAGINAPGGRLFDEFLLSGGRFLDGGHIYSGVAQGDWWRLITAAFLHASILHIGLNMYVLWIIGRPVEQYLGRARFIGLYFVSGLAGSAGALVLTPHAVTVGASGAIFGILGALLIIEWQTTGRLAGNAMTWIVINLALSFVISNVSIGGHVGGLIGGILVTLAFANWGRGHAAYGKIGPMGFAGLAGVAVASVAIAYFRVRGMA
jgi:membrane associated rhomboid family serine protease